jgi:hypothetical protein
MESRFPSYRRALYLNYMSAATYNFEVSPALIHPELRVPWIKTRPMINLLRAGRAPTWRIFRRIGRSRILRRWWGDGARTAALAEQRSVI